GQLGGALAAALLAKRGYRVLLVEHDGVGPGYEHHGYLLPFAPFVTPQMRAMPAMEQGLSELGLNTVVQRALKPHDPELQLVLPDHRADLSQNPEKRASELKREFGDEGAQLGVELGALEQEYEQSHAFFRSLPDLPPDGMMEEWNLKKQLKKFSGLQEGSPFQGSGPAAELMRAFLPFLTYLASPEGPLATRRLLSQVVHSPGHFPGGREGLRQVICKKLIDLGGDILDADGDESSVAEAFVFDGSKLAGISVLNAEAVYRAQCVVGATDSQAMRRLIPDKKAQKKLADTLDVSTTKRFMFTVNWVISADALPCGMGELVLMDTQDPALGPMLIQVHSARKADGKEDPALRVVCAGAFVPSGTRDLGEAHLKSLAASISKHLGALMPFADRNRELVSAPYLDAGGVRGSRLMPHPLYEIALPALLGVTGLSQRTPLKNFFLANREVLPGLGLEGEFMAGLRAVKLVHETLKKRDMLKV
ncbi:MAG TPA: desaturase, partial [Myxococcaceae bacterium]|nr:desaturase [Myxococcaceae bacterium]